MRRRMDRRRPTFALLSCLIVAVGALSGCANTRENDAGREGKPAEIGNVDYNIFITRELNLRDLEDEGYYRGPEAPPGYALYGVFLQACNPADSSSIRQVQSSSNFTIVDTQGNRFRPIPLPATNLWAYRPRPLAGGQCIPRTGTLAASGPTNGSLLIFKLPLATLENRPLDLIITSPPGANGPSKTGRVELDI